tara:strand:- start:10406 stop:11215 length:810 start_codon:yes stop_codon:yes gene_type:complete
MSVLSDKNVLIVGEDNPQISNLENLLKTNNAHLHHALCGDVTDDSVESAKIDVVILNHLHDGDICKNTLLALRDGRTGKVVPVFVLVDGSEERIQEAYALGAADYIIPEEDVESVMLKINAVVGQDEDFSDGSAIDITPGKVEVTTSGVRVYVIEDDPLLRNLLSIKLEKSEFPYEFSSDGRNVIEAMQQFKPDIVILDLMLPGKSGFDVLAEIKDNETLKELPVLVFSNRDGQDDKHRAEELGAVGFYVKAMTDLSELIETIESHVSK